MKISLNPYLIFNGNAKEAMGFYQSIFGGELEISTYGESGTPVAGEDKDRIIHANLKNGDLILMASDDNVKSPVHIGNNVHMSLVGTDKEKLTKYFEQLSIGGKINTPLVTQAWGDVFGMLTDKFEVHWMVNISSS